MRLSDFKSNEYRKLLGGEIYEPEEETPCWASVARRYIAHSFRDCFEMECAAMKKVRNELGLTNVQLMVPFVVTWTKPRRGRSCWPSMASSAARTTSSSSRCARSRPTPCWPNSSSNTSDGFSIGSNDLAQLTLGLDRDSGLVAHSFDRARSGRQAAAVDGHPGRQQARQVRRHLRGPSDHPDLAEWLMDEGIQTISLSPDTVIDTWLKLAAHGRASDRASKLTRCK